MSWRRKTDQAVMQTFGERIKAARLQGNYTQEQLAEKAGVSRRTVQLFESGEGGNLTTFIQIVRALGQIDQLSEILAPTEQISPLQLLKEQPARYRVRHKKK